MLDRDYNTNKDVDNDRVQHLSVEKESNRKRNIECLPPKDMVAEKSGYIFWKDSKLVIFYCNDLKLTPSSDLLLGNEVEAITCVNCLAPVQRCTGVETLHRTKFDAPAIIVEYKMFMGGVYLMDKRLETNAKVRVEKNVHVHIHFFGPWIL